MKIDQYLNDELQKLCETTPAAAIGYRIKSLKHFEKTYHPRSLVSYVDRRWSQGKVHKALGFQLDHVSRPDYWYFKPNLLKLESRVRYQKHKLKHLFSSVDESKSEVKNMTDNGYHRIFDSGNLVFAKVYQTVQLR